MHVLSRYLERALATSSAKLWAGRFLQQFRILGHSLRNQAVLQ